MAKIRICGKQYDLYFGLWAMEQVEKEYGDLKQALAEYRKNRKIDQVKFMFAAMANNGRKRAGQKPDVKPEVLDVCSVGDLEKISEAMLAAMEEASHVETVGGGEADDEEADALAAEYDEKNG